MLLHPHAYVDAQRVPARTLALGRVLHRDADALLEADEALGPRGAVVARQLVQRHARDAAELDVELARDGRVAERQVVVHLAHKRVRHLVRR